MSENTNDIQKYFNWGFNQMPVGQDKVPTIKTWKEYQTNIFSDLKAFEGNQVAIITGKISDNLETLDFDNHFGTAKENLTKFIEYPLVKEIYEKYKLPIIQSQRKGYHIYYRCNFIEGSQKLASIPVWNEKLKKDLPDAIIETRGEGGYILSPLSNGYDIKKNSLKDLQYISKEERTILIEFAKSFNQFVKPTENYKHKVSDESPGNIYNSLPESIEDAKQILLNEGWKETNFNNGWTRPGKNKGISATFGNVSDNVFYVFTSNTSHFDLNKAYTPFQIKSLVEYGGDFSKCAKDLAEKLGLKPTSIEQKTEVNNNEQLINRVFKNSRIDFSKKYKKPHYIIKIKDAVPLNIGSLGNFSCITGKSKARKSFARFFIEAACLGNKTIQNKFIVDLPTDKRNIIYFDTEQSIDNVFDAAYRIIKMAEVAHVNNYEVFALRNYSHLERCIIIEEIIKKSKNLGVVFIDGVSDLAFGNNDELEANRVAQLLMNWTANYNIHICTVIHQPKGADWATGHLGSAIEKKAESVIGVKKDGNYSIIEAKQLRSSMDFTPFPFNIVDSMPELIEFEKEEDEENEPF